MGIMKRVTLSILTALLGLGVACVPRTAPPPPSQPSPVATLAAPSTPQATSSPQPSEWDKVIAAAKKEGKITAYSFHFIGDVGTGVAKAFKDKYGIEIETISGPGMQLIERIRSEQRAGQGVADLLTTGASIVFVAKSQGLTQPVGDLPVLQQEGPWLSYPPLDPERHVLNFALTAILPIVNTNLVKPQEEPTSWLDLLGPQWKGKMSLADPASIPNAGYIYLALTTRKGISKDYFVKLGQQDLKLVNTTRDISASVARGEVALAFGASDATTAPLAAQGAPVKAIDMKEGIPLPGGGAIALLAQNPHPNATRLFINWFLSQEGQTTYTKLDPRLSVRKDVADPRPAGVRLIPKEPLVITGKDEEEVGRIMRERELAKLILGK